MKILSALPLLLLSTVSLAQQPTPAAPAQTAPVEPAPVGASEVLCPNIMKMPGVVYFSEKQLSLNNAMAALEDLEKAIAEPETTLDTTSMENDLIVLRGAIFRLTLLEQQLKNGNTDPALLRKFCEFMQADAVLRR